MNTPFVFGLVIGGSVFVVLVVCAVLVWRQRHDKHSRGKWK